MIFGINYAPEQTGIAPYNTGMAEYLAAQGASVDVIAGVPHYPAWRVQSGYKWKVRVKETRENLSVLRVWHFVPRTMNTRKRVLYEATFMLHAAIRSRRCKPDLIIAVSPALGGAVAAALLAKRRNVPLITVVQDLMGVAATESGITSGGTAPTVARTVESFALSRSNRVLVISEGFREALLKYGVDNSKIGVLRNWTHITTNVLTKREARARLGWRQDIRIAVHTGNMGFKQDLSNIVEAARGLSLDDKTEILLIGDGSQRQSLQRSAKGIPYLRFAEPVSTDRYVLILAAADVLLVNERTSVSEMSLPSKVTSYLAAGRPILAAVTKDGSSWRELSSAGGAVLVPPGNPELLRNALLDLLNDAPRQDVLGTAGRDYARANLSPSASLLRLRQEVQAAFVLGGRT